MKRVIPYVLAGLLGVAAGYFLRSPDAALLAELEDRSRQLRECEDRLPR